VILVTGGAGYIGRHTVQALEREGFETLIFDDFSTGHRDFVGDVPFIKGDICRFEDLQTAFSSYPIEGVLHFAGKALVAESREHPELYYETNVGGGLNLLRAMTEARVRPLVFSSTCATYGVPQTESIAEEHPQNPINPYGETKLAFERAMTWFGSAHGIRHVSLRYFNAAGADPDGSYGEDHVPETHLIPLVLEAAARLRNDVVIHGTDYPTPDGTCVRDYVHVTDLAQAHVTALRMLMEGTIESQAVNLGTGQGASVREIIEAAQKVTERELTVTEGPRREGDPPRLVAAVEKASALLDWSPQYSDVALIVETAWRWLKKRKGV
jgi:UDP-glucose 4-epimerase